MPHNSKLSTVDFGAGGKRMDKAAMLDTMAAMQDAHNIQVHPNGAPAASNTTGRYGWSGAELLDHFGWKWWKRQHPTWSRSSSNS